MKHMEGSVPSEPKMEGDAPSSPLLQLGQRFDRPKPPSPESVEMKFSPKAVKELEALLTHYPDKKSAILPALWIAQREYDGWLPPNAIAEVALRLSRPYAEIEGVATFYTMYEKHKVGKHLIEVCTCLTCHVKGAYRLLDHLRAKLGIDLGETTPDGMFTLKEVECLDACDRAPVLQHGADYIGPVDEKQMDELLEKWRNDDKDHVIQLANDVVRCQLRADEGN
jgi:NADH-quinone oxidoreductase E subunit